jgi:serine phosphatase RsbU (regulator of sigma subunit)/ligand-binding sensor domain-containing protein
MRFHAPITNSFWLFLFCLIIQYGTGQNSFPVGHLSITNYSAEEYNLQNQNFDVNQDNRGLMYFGNNGGLLEYDGHYWQSISVLERQVFSLSKSRNGQLWIGSNGTFGSLSFDNKGKAIFAKVKGLESFTEDETGEIRNLVCIDDRVYFFSKNNSIFIYENKKLRRVKTDNSIQSAFVINNQLIFQIEGQGLNTLLDNQIVPIDGGEKCGNSTIIAAIQISDSLLVYNAEGFCFSLGKKSNKLVVTGNVARLNLPYKGIRDLLRWQDKLIVATADNGIYTVGKDGSTIHHINKKNGLVNDKVEKLYIDRQRNLWVVTADGISKIDISSAITYFDYLDGVNGTIESICTLGNKLYIATGEGLYYIDKNNQEENQKFKKVADLNSEIWSLQKISVKGEDFLLIAENNAVYQLSIRGELRKVTDCYPWSFHQLRKNPKVVLAAVEPSGFLAIQTTDNELQQKDVSNAIEIPIKKISEGNDGQLWLAGTQNDLYAMHYKNEEDNIVIANLKKFIHGDGSNLPRSAIYPENIDGKVYFGTQRGFYFYDSAGNKFLPDSKLNEVFEGQGYSVHRFNQDKSNRIWLVAYDTITQKKYFIGYGTKNGLKYKWTNQPFLKISRNIIHSIYHDEDGLTWLGGPKGLYRFDSKNDFSSEFKYQLHVRKIVTGEETYANYFNPKDSTSIPIFPFTSTNFAFEFSSPNFFDEKNNSFSFFLEGLNDHWSEWQSQPLISYTNLREGTYTLKVKARDIYGNESDVYYLEFKIAPPWYRTWTAYLCYILFMLALIYISIKLSIRRLQKANIKLENIVSERTKEIQEKNKTLEEQKNVVESQKNDIEHKRKEIVDSINYASRLQQAIIPTEDNFRKVLPHSFILFKPKDIVSGDFYWLGKQDDCVLYVTADCTGHGVPGAFMSMLGTSLLNEIVNEKKIIEPAEILNQLRDRIIIALNQSGSVVENKDGMDMVIIRFDRDFKKMVYAAANNSFYLIREGEIIEQKADKMPVGYYGEFMRPFSQQEISLHQGDFIYTFTDGYADQFGGPKGKKFKYKQLEEKLLLIFKEDSEKQKLFLDDVFEKWKEGHEQIDDICIIGVKINF